MKTYRGSEAPLAMLCAGSVNPEPDEILIDTINPAGTVGTVVHKICEFIVRTGGVPEEWHWQEICDGHGLDHAQQTDVLHLMYAAQDCWNMYGPNFMTPEIEWPVNWLFHKPGKDEWALSVHEDVMALLDGHGFILDWKSTRLDIDYTAQVLAYAWALTLVYPHLQDVTTILAFLRDRTVNIKVWTIDQIEAFADRFVREVVNWDGRTYRPGGHCAYCRRFLSCPARQALVKKTIAEMDGLPTTGLVEFYQRVQVVEALTQKARDQIRATVEQAGGEIKSQDGKRLVLSPSSRPHIDAKLAWPVITQVLEPDEFAPAVEISKGKLLDIVGDKAPRGQKGKAKAAMTEALEKAGALTKTEFNVLRVMQGDTKEKEITSGE